MNSSIAAPRYAILTWGCQMNEHDSEKMAGSLRELGYVRASGPEDADIVLLNTCAIREKATDKVFSELGRLRALKEGVRRPLLGVCGCVAQMEGEKIFERAPFVDFVLGPRGISRLPDLIAAAKRRRRSIDVVHHQESVLFPWQIADRRDGPHAYVTVVEGCNKQCTFCIVPTTRGPEASRTVEAIVLEVESLARDGRREIEFLGQTVNAYRDERGRRLCDLLRAVDGIPGLARIRFTTSHPVHLTDDLIRAMAELPRVCPHIHLPVQSGSDSVLRRMRRGYTGRGYLDRIEALRRAIPGIEVSTDVIVGFPGETQEDFEATLSLVREAQFSTVYAFTYSPRPGTEAATFPDEVSTSERDERLATLLELQRSIQQSANRRRIGAVLEVMVDGPSKKDPCEWTGRTRENLTVNFRYPESFPGALLSLQITEVTPFSLRGVSIS